MGHEASGVVVSTGENVDDLEEVRVLPSIQWCPAVTVIFADKAMVIYAIIAWC